MTERELLSGVLDVAKLFGWRTLHIRPAMTQNGWRTAIQGNGKGWPDLVLVRDRIIFRELKTGRNTLSVEQAEWILALRKAGADAGVWTENDWWAGTIEAELRRVVAVAA